MTKSILDEFLAWGSPRNAAKKSKLGEVLTYLNSYGKELTEYLSGGFEIGYNLEELSIKPLVIAGRTICLPTPQGGPNPEQVHSV